MADVAAIAALSRSSDPSARLQALDHLTTHLSTNTAADSASPSLSPSPSSLSSHPPPLLTLLPLLFTLLTDSDAVIRSRAASTLPSALPSLASLPPTSLLSTLSDCLTTLDVTQPSCTAGFQSLPLLLSSLPSSPLAPHPSLTSLASSLISHLPIPPLYTASDDLRQQSLTPPPHHPSLHSAYLTNTHCVLQSLLSLPLLHPLPTPLRIDLTLSLIGHSFSIPSTFHSRYLPSSLSLLVPEWVSPSNAELSLRLQRRLLTSLTPHPSSPPLPSDDEVMQGMLYEALLPPLLKRLRGRMGGKGKGKGQGEGQGQGKGREEWRADVSTPYILFHCLSHLAPTPFTSSLLAERVHDVVPLLLPLLNDWLDRSRCMGSLLLSHLLTLLPFHSVAAFAPLLHHTLDALLTDRDSAAIHVVLPTSVDLLLSTVPPFPLPSAVEEEGRVSARLRFFASFLSALSFLSLSSSAAAPLIRAYLEQLVRLLLFLHRDVLVSLGELLQVLWRLGGYWDEGVRERAWVCVGWVMEVGGRAMRRRAAEVVERLWMAELDAERQVELSARSIAFVGSDSVMGDAAFVVDAKERSAGWSRTVQQVRDMRARIAHKWPGLI